MALKEIPTLPKPKRKHSITLRWFMALGFGGLVALAVGLVLTMSVATNFSNTYSLLNTRAQQLIDTMERSIRSQTDQAERTVRAMAKLFAEDGLQIGKLEPGQQHQRQALLESLMIASPVVETLLIYDKNGNRSGVFRTPQGIFIPIAYGPGESTEIEALLSTAIPSGEAVPVWGEPLMINNILFHNVGFPLTRDGEIQGVAVAAIGQSNMNRILADLGRNNDTTAFVLTSDNKVIAHSQNSGYFNSRPVFDIDDFPDNALHQFRDAELVEEFDTPAHHNMSVFESGRGINKSGFVFIVRELKGYSAKPYRLGAYFAKAEISTEIRRILRSLLAGLAALILAVTASIFLSRRLSKPMKKIAGVANDFSNLDLDDFTPLPASRIREINDQAQAMNSMHTALNEFSRYVPRPLVKRLMRSGTRATRSVEREVTIMFADIAAFTSMSEELNAVETAALLNSHFDVLCRHIDQHNGTVDKFIGDGLMAFWGAPDADDNQAGNALNAAIDIARAINTINIDKDQSARPPMRLRIGIHTGRVVVGNIGSCDRQNYTLVGDAVNVANRLEQYGKKFIGDDDVIILTSRDTWEKAGMPSNMQSAGFQKLRGREALIEIFAVGGEFDAKNIPGTQSVTG